jgi:hypothetical protein
VGGLMLLEDLKAAAEKISGIARPEKVVPRKRKPRKLRFADDGETPQQSPLPAPDLSLAGAA